MFPTLRIPLGEEWTDRADVARDESQALSISLRQNVLIRFLEVSAVLPVGDGDDRAIRLVPSYFLNGPVRYVRVQEQAQHALWLLSTVGRLKHLQVRKHCPESVQVERFAVLNGSFDLVRIPARI